MKKSLQLCYLTILTGATLAGCGGGEAPATPEGAPVAETVAAPAPATEETAFAETATSTTLAPITLPPFTIRSEYLGEVSRGHFNLYIEGEGAAAVRAWVGDEAASNAVVTRAEFEVDHHCAHMEMPDPIPADARLWIEIETPTGELHKGSTALK